MLDIRVMDGADRTTVVLDGEVDMSTSDRVRSTANSALAQHPDVLVVDLRLVRFIDSTGLRLLIGAARRAETAAYRLRIVRPGAPVFRVFEIAGVDALLPFAEADA